jgi:ACT domain-containing protein
MLMISDITASKISLQALQQVLKEKGQEIGLDIKLQHEDIFKIMHRI